MSLSPTEKSTSAEIFAYDKGWAAVNRLIRAGRSFSGRERNCCFLNTGQTAFANISSSVELNLPDDGRGLSATDWDWDGRLDFWITNRNGPRVRFLKNEYQTDFDFVALRLKGTQSNRDAIGARVQLFLAGQSQPLIKTVYAGVGYISQSTKWLHFGLGKDATIERVVVRWPGGETETFRGMDANQRYQLVEGRGSAVAWQAPTVGPWQPSVATEPNSSAASRVVLLSPTPLPNQLQCRDLQGNVRPVLKMGDSSKGLLINLWATWCSNCVGELSRWSADADRLQQAGLDVLTVAMDEPTDDPAADRTRLAAVVQQLNLPFDVAVGDQQLAEILNVFQRAFIGHQSDLPLPSSLLIDADGQLAAIYKGPVEVDQLLRDAELLGKSSDRIFEGAIPFPGKWLERPPTVKPRQAAVALLEHGYQDAAADYAKQLLSHLDLDAEELTDNSEMLKAEQQEYASLHHLIGAIAFDRQQYDVARKHYDASLTTTPHNRSLRREFYRTLIELGEFEQAAEQLEVLLRGYPQDAETLTDLARLRINLGQRDVGIRLFEKSLKLKADPAARFEMANALRDSMRYADAVREYRAVMAAIPSPVVLNNLAWLLATASDNTIRDGDEAVRLAEKACEVTSYKAARMLGTLAAAYAEQGNFRRAVETIQHAIQQADASDSTLVDELRKRRQDYQNKQPTRD